MDNVKEFINKFVLSESKIDVASLRENIETLSELEALLERSQKQYTALENILNVHKEIEKKDYDIAVNDMLLSIADKDALELELEELEKEIRLKEQYIESTEEQVKKVDANIKKVTDQIIDINVAIQSNSANNIANAIKARIE